MNVHHHIDRPFLCIKSTPIGWALTEGECKAELVEMCSEAVLGDIRFFPSRTALLDELRHRKLPASALRGAEAAVPKA